MEPPITKIGTNWARNVMELSLSKTADISGTQAKNMMIMTGIIIFSALLPSSVGL